MHRVLALRGRIREYAWGSRTALAELLGEPAPSAAPQAELWMGDHASAPSSVRVDGVWKPLPDWIARDPECVLGEACVARFGPRLPFLLKVLAAERPLSLQTHPDADHAARGFGREERAGVPRTAPARAFPDPRAKPELVCARTAFRALCGFRAPAEIADDLRGLREAPLAPLVEALSAGPDEEALREGFRRWLGGTPEAGTVLAEAAVTAARAGRGDPTRAARVAELAALFPGDPGVLAPYWLHGLELRPEEALFLAPGELHAYLGGVAVEIMASSDNVLRAGLTEKPVDAGALSECLRFAPSTPEPRSARSGAPGEAVYDTPAPEFELAALRPAPGRPVAGGDERGVEILLCVEGAARVVAAGGGDPVPLARGAAALVPAACAGYRVDGDALVYRAGVPRRRA